MSINKVFPLLTLLNKHNDREWVAAHYDVYKDLKRIRDDIGARFLAAVAKVDPGAETLDVADCVYRLVRDTRFSEDKTPYKTHIGVYVCPPLGKKSLMAGYYLHLEPGKSMLWGGCYGLPTKYLTAIRADIRDNIEEYLGIVESSDFKEFFPRVGDDPLSTAPKGFDLNWEYIDYVRPREFGAMIHLPDSYFDRSDFAESLIPALTQLRRLIDFLNYTLTESGLPLMRPTR